MIQIRLAYCYKGQCRIETFPTTIWQHCSLTIFPICRHTRQTNLKTAQLVSRLRWNSWVTIIRMRISGSMRYLLAVLLALRPAGRSYLWEIIILLLHGFASGRSEGRSQFPSSLRSWIERFKARTCVIIIEVQTFRHIILN